MIGGRRYPSKPRRLIMLSRDKLGFSSGGGLAGLFFGLLFSSAGLLVLGSVCVTAFNLKIPYVIGVSDPANQKSVFALLFGILFGGCFLALGSVMLSTFRCTIDRRRQTVTIRSGWLGLWKTTTALADFDHVMVAPSTRWSYHSGYNLTFEIMLAGKRGHYDHFLTVGYATVETKGAEEIALEISQFCGLPVG